MKYTVITTFNQSGLDLYGRSMVESFDRFWPRSVDLYVYTENCQLDITSDRVKILDLLESSPDLVGFKKQHANNPIANGMIAKDTNLPFKDNAFKWDAVRFSHKVFAVIHACQHIDSDWVIWLDADSKTFRSIPETFLPEVCDPKAMACYLGRREKYHSECGWVAYNLKHPDLESFINRWRDLYVTGDLFNLREYHDCFVFDVLRREFQLSKNTYFHNLSPETHGKGPGHPFIASALGAYIDHLKGNRRKQLGKSQWKGDADSAIFHPDVDYWQN